MSKKNNEQIELHKLEVVKEVPMHDQVHADMQRYALYVTRHRMTADYRDGFMPVERRLISAMLIHAGLRAIGKRMKSHAIVGLTLTHYHPHGDTSVYGAMKPLANWFESKQVLIDKQGNFGSLYGDVASADRYTEAGLSEFALDVVLGDLIESKQSVDWIKNYNDTEYEPEYLPCKVPMLLINGSFGIGVGMKPEIPSHNLSEVIDVTLKLIDNPNADFVLIPDHCMGCEIINTDWKKINNGQLGSYKIRSKIDIVDSNNGTQELIIRSIPNLTFLKSIDEAIEDMMANNELPQISKVEDRSTDDYCEYHIKLKRGADPIYVRDTIWKRTNAMQSCRVNLETLYNGAPIVMSYREYLLAFIEQRKLTKFRLYSNKIQEYDTKIHEKEAYIKVLSSGEVDEVIKLIRNRKGGTDEQLIEFLIKKFKITDLQAEFIINVKIKALSIDYLERYIAEQKEYTRLREEIHNKLVNEELLIKDIKDELIAIKKKYGTPRVCTVVNDDIDDVPSGLFHIIVTANNFIRKIPASEQIKNNRSDNIKVALTGDNRESILIFDDMGKVFRLPISKIPVTDRNGTDIRFLIKNLTSNINTIIYEPTVVAFNEKETKYFLTIVTAQGNTKKMDLEDFTNVPPSGILYIKLDAGDTVRKILIISDQFDILACAGKSGIRIPLKEIPWLKRNTKGSRVMTTNHPVEFISTITPKSEYIVVITKNGFINKFSSVALQPKARGKSGNQIIKLNKGDNIVAAYGANDIDALQIWTPSGPVNVNLAEIPVGSSIGPGVKAIQNKTDIVLNCKLILKK